MWKNRVFKRKPHMFVANIAGLCFVLAVVIGGKRQALAGEARDSESATASAQTSSTIGPNAVPDRPAGSEPSRVSGQLADSSNWGPVRKHQDNPHYFLTKESHCC